MLNKILRCLLTVLLCLSMTACASVDVIRLTSETFPPKASVDDVEVLEQEPTNPHIQLAELRMASSMLGFDTMQHKILKKAATLGADAVVFFQPQSHVEHQTTYEPVYDPWGYYAPFYGSGAWG